jgi:hypothetical protein
LPPTFRFPSPVVIDCHFLIFALTLTAAERKAGKRPDAYRLIHAFEEGRFAWVWHDDILAEYEDTITWLIANHRAGQPTLDKRAAGRIIRDIRMAGLYAPITDAVYAAARAAVMSPTRPAEERDEDDVIYPSCRRRGGCRGTVVERPFSEEHLAGLQGHHRNFRPHGVSRLGGL